MTRPAPLDGPVGIGELLGDLFADLTLAGVPAARPLAEMTDAQAQLVVEAFMRCARVALKTQAAGAAARHQVRARGGLRLVAENGRPTVDGRTLAAVRRRKPIYVMEAS